MTKLWFLGDRTHSERENHSLTANHENEIMSLFSNAFDPLFRTSRFPSALFD